VSEPAPPLPTSPLEPWPDAVDWRPVSPRLVWVEELQLLGGTVPVLAACALGWAALGDPLSTLAGLAGLAVVVVAAARAVLIPRVVRAWGYAERQRDLLVRHGRLVRRLSIVPYARMQFVDVSAGPLERAFRLATVQLHTAAAASDARVPGLAPAEASRLRDRLTALGEDRAEGL
jgi:membrane protein YdbS with pleckstrin-like domain